MNRRVLLSMASSLALFAAACGGGGTTITPPPPNNGFSNSNLSGQYAFSMSGSASTANGAVSLTRVGVFVANGSGTVTGGAEDVTIFGSGTEELDFTGGTYSVNSDGTGTMTLNNSTGSLVFSITLTSSSAGYIVPFPTDASESASGSFVKQVAGPFALTNVSGSYAFDFSGSDSQGFDESYMGQISANGTGNFTTGLLDDNDAATVNGGVAGPASISGTYAEDPLHTSDFTSFGRCVVSLPGVTGVLYVVGPNQFKFMETSSGGTLTGDAFLQSNIPTSTAQLSGSFVYVMGGAGSGVPITRGGKVSLASGATSNAIVDSNNSGQLLSLTGNAGTYTIDAAGSGRGTITFTAQGQQNAFQYVFYMVSPTQLFVQDQSLNIVEDGSMLAQGTSTISTSSLAGNYGINWSGVTEAQNVTGEEDLIGEATIGSSGSLAGTIDLNEFAVFEQFTGVPLTGTLTLNSDPTSHNSMTVNLATNPANDGLTLFAYIANNNTILLMGSQKNVRITAGVMTPQNP